MCIIARAPSLTTSLKFNDFWQFRFKSAANKKRGERTTNLPLGDRILYVPQLSPARQEKPSRLSPHNCLNIIVVGTVMLVFVCLFVSASVCVCVTISKYHNGNTSDGHREGHIRHVTSTFCFARGFAGWINGTAKLNGCHLLHSQNRNVASTHQLTPVSRSPVPFLRASSFFSSSLSPPFSPSLTWCLFHVLNLSHHHHHHYLEDEECAVSSFVYSFFFFSLLTFSRRVSSLITEL